MFDWVCCKLTQTSSTRASGGSIHRIRELQRLNSASSSAQQQLSAIAARRSSFCNDTTAAFVLACRPGGQAGRSAGVSEPAGGKWRWRFHVGQLEYVNKRGGEEDLLSERRT